MTNARDKANIPVLNFQSKGIDDNADATAITIDSSERVGIGTTAPSNYYSNKLVIDCGSASQDGLTIVSESTKDGMIGFADGTSGNDRFSGFIIYDHPDNEFRIASNAGVGLLAISENEFRVSTNSSERMRINSTGLGIGTSSPSAKLDILATGNNASAISTTVSDYAIKLASATTSNYFSNGLVFSEGNTSGSAIGSFDGGSSGRQGLWFATHDGSSMAERMRIDSSGKIGIGTTDPKTSLHITKSSLTGFVSRTASTLTLENSGGTEIYLASANSSYGQIRFGDDASTYSGGIQYEHNHDHMLFQVNSAERMRIDSSGKIGIGTTSPEQKLDVNGIAQIKTQTSGTRRLRIKDSVTSQYFDIGVAISSSQPNLTFSDGADERMRITSDGDLTIGSTTTDEQLHVKGRRGLTKVNGTHRVIEFYTNITASTSASNLFTATCSNAHSSFYYEIIVNGNDWSGHSSARVIKRGFHVPNTTYSEHSVVESSGTHANDITYSYSRSGNTFTGKLTLDTGGVGLNCYVKLVGMIASYTVAGTE